MPRSRTTSRPSWPRYGVVPMMMCPNCPHIAPLKRLVTMNEVNGNYGRGFVKCESKPEEGKDLKNCRHFEWMDEYIERIKLESGG
uniref:Uncharacterized protein n=1 Tax=Avena sativa TaxID=4498 RepID=A0ACD6AHP3_AVESA